MSTETDAQLLTQVRSTVSVDSFHTEKAGASSLPHSDGLVHLSCSHERSVKKYVFGWLREIYFGCETQLGIDCE